MADGERLLSDEEMEAIGEVVASGELGEGYNVGLETTPFELASDQNRGTFDTAFLDQVNERLQRFLKLNIRNELNYLIDLKAQAVEICQYKKLLETAKNPAIFNVTRISPLKEECLVLFDSGVIFSCVDAWFGGGQKSTPVESATRHFSATEDLVAKKMRIALYSALIEAWAPALEVQCELLRSETDSELLELFGAEDLILVNRFLFGGEDNALGKIEIIYPLESVKLARGSMVERTERPIHKNRLEKIWSRNLEEAVGEVPFEVVVEAGKVPVFLGDLERLQVGDMIPLKDLESSELKVNGLTLFKVEIGSRGGNTAIKVLERTNQESVA